MIEFPTPSGYRKSVPVHAAPLPLTDKAKRAERRRWVIGFIVAAVFHTGIILAWFLTPPLKLKTNPDPRRWVQVISIPKALPNPTPTNAGASSETSAHTHRSRAHDKGRGAKPGTPSHETVPPAAP